MAVDMPAGRAEHVTSAETCSGAAGKLHAELPEIQRHSVNVVAEHVAQHK
jgi:hypothetical protein